jgi:hypothetical protein
MSTLRMTRQSTFFPTASAHEIERERTGAFTRVFLSQGEEIATMTTPIRPNIREGFKPMWNPMIQFLLIRVLRE